MESTPEEKKMIEKVKSRKKQKENYINQVTTILQDINEPIEVSKRFCY